MAGKAGLCRPAYAAPTPPLRKGQSKRAMRKEGAGKTESRAVGVLCACCCWPASLVPFYIQYPIWRCSLLPVDQLPAAGLSSVLLLACSIFLHFLYKEMGRRGGEKRGGSRTVLRQHHLKGARCEAGK